MRYTLFALSALLMFPNLSLAEEKRPEQYTQAATQTPEEIDVQMKDELEDATTPEEKQIIIDKYAQIKDAAAKATQHLDVAPEVIDKDKLGDGKGVLDSGDEDTDTSSDSEDDGDTE